ncbi:hypothetical protein F4860DRAFT_516278 [Xylaria cubensis]|nr:hypothetical protein F4860DRAFT_516278 [Xylaria cubensis]
MAPRSKKIQDLLQDHSGELYEAIDEVNNRAARDSLHYRQNNPIRWLARDLIPGMNLLQGRRSVERGQATLPPPTISRRTAAEGAAATILLVAVEPASLQWEDGINIALSCREIIRKFKIFDVEVEIMEGRYI